MSTDQGTLTLTHRGFKDRMLSGYKLWFILSLTAGLLGALVVIVRTVNETNLGPMMLAGGDMTAAFQNALRVEAVTSRLWMQLFLLSLSFAKLGVVSAIYVSIKNIRARRGVDVEGKNLPFYERFYKIAPIIGSEIQIFNLLFVSIAWAILATLTVGVAVSATQYLGAVVVPLEFLGASFSLLGLALALATYAAEPKGAETARRAIPSGLLKFTYASFFIGISGFLVLFPLRAYAIATIHGGPGTANFVGAMKIDAVLGLITENWMFVGVGGLFLVWALWLYQIAKNDHANCCLGNMFWASRIVPALAIFGFLIVIGNMGAALWGISSTIDVAGARAIGESPGPVMLTATKFMITATMIKMFGIGVIMAAVGLGSAALSGYAHPDLHAEQRQAFKAPAAWANWWAIAPGLGFVAFVTIPVTIWLLYLLSNWAPVIMMGMPGEAFPGFQRDFLDFRILMAVAPGAMMVGLVLTFLGAFGYKISAVRAWSN